MRTLAQAIRNAIEIERAAARFYAQLVDKAADDKTRDFLQDMCQQEEAHARVIQEMGDKINGGDLPAHPDDRIQGVETAPDWTYAESIELVQALNLAIEAENNASLYYDAMADSTQGEVAQFFRDLTITEEQHAQKLREFLESIEP